MDGHPRQRPLETNAAPSTAIHWHEIGAAVASGYKVNMALVSVLVTAFYSF